MNLSKWAFSSFLQPEFVAKMKSVYVTGNQNTTCAFIITHDDKVYGAGYDKHVMNFNSANTFSPIEIETFSKVKVKCFAGGLYHMVALTECGNVYTWGENSNGCLGNNTTNSVSLPALITKFASIRIVKICCGDHHTLALAEDGKVYGWGYNDNGQVDYNTTATGTVYEPKQITENVQHMTSVACMRNASFAVSSTGKVYSWGDNSYNQLGVPSNTYIIKQPVTLRFPTKEIKIAKISCGAYHVLALSDDGKVLSWGKNHCRQLGRSTTANIVDYVTNLKRVVDIAAFQNTSAAKTLDGGVYVWGRALSYNVNLPFRTSFKQISDVFAYLPQNYEGPKMHRTLDVYVEENYSWPKIMFNNEAFSDITIVVEDKPIYVHRAILKTGSDYFRAMLNGNWKETNPLVIDNCSYNAYRAFLFYIYTGILDIKEMQEALELLELANFVCEETLKQKCSEGIKALVTIENVPVVYTASITCELQDLKEWCVQFSASKMALILQSESIDSLNPDEFKAYMKTVAKGGGFRG